MKKVGDRFYIRSKIMPYDSYDPANCNFYRVCTSRANGHDRFLKDKCNIVDGYVVHEVEVYRIDEYSDGNYAYIVKNTDETLSTLGKDAWQGCGDEDIVSMK